MPSRWINRGPLDSERNPEDFPKAPDPYRDPGAQLSQWLEAVRIFPLSAREWKCRNGWEVGPRTLNNSIWISFPSGRGTLHLHNSRTQLDFGPKDIILLPTGVRHSVQLKGRVHTTHFSVHFHAYVFGSIDFLDLLGFPPIIRNPEHDLVEKGPRLAGEYAVKSPGWNRLMAAEIFDGLVRILRTRGSLFKKATHPKKELPRLLPALKLIEKKWSDPDLHIRHLAQSIHMSEVYFRKLFRRVTGTSPSIFIQRRRIEQSCMLLRGTQQSIKQIAESSGFSDLAFFYRTFREWTASTPAAFRRAKEV